MSVGVLTRCEREIAERIALGATKKEVADQTFRSVGTVETTLKHIYEKLGIRKVSELTLWYVGEVWGISREIAERQRRVFAMCLVAIMMVDITMDMSGDPMRNRRTARRRWDETEIVYYKTKTI